MTNAKPTSTPVAIAQCNGKLWIAKHPPEHASNLPWREPTSPLAVVLCDGQVWVNTGGGWGSKVNHHMRTWDGLREFAAEKGGATLHDLANLPTGFTPEQQDAMRKAFPDAVGEHFVSTTWTSGKKTTELLRIASMEGAQAMVMNGGVTRLGPVSVKRDSHGVAFLAIGGDDHNPAYRVHPGLPDWTITVTAPTLIDPTDDDPVVKAFVDDDTRKRILFRTEDGKWSELRGAKQGVWATDCLTEIERLSPNTIAELMR